MGKAENTAKGAAGGAAMGAALGPWGAAAGGVIGGALGYFGSGGSKGGLSKEQEALYMQYMQDRANMQAPVSDLRKNQLSLVKDLEAQAAGRGPSLAAEQLNAAVDKNTQQQTSFANSARGSAIPLAMFQAQNNVAQLGAQAGQDAAAARIAEQVAARNQLGLTLHGARGMDEEGALRQRAMNNEFIGRAMQTFSGKAPVASLGEQVLAGGAQVAASRGYGIGGAAQQQPGYDPTYGGAGVNGPVGDGTLNPFEQNQFQATRRRQMA
jgi:hypothetical protein